MTEIWKTVFSFPDYEVSNLGRVRRAVMSQRGVHAGRVLKGKLTSWGYVEVTLYLKGKRHFCRVNRLVCEAFNGPPPEGKTFALHRDDVKINNTPNNLYWGDRVENGADAVKNNRYLRGSKHPRALHLTEDQVVTIRQLGNSGMLTFRELGARFGVSKAEAHRIFHRKSRGDI